MFSKMIHIKIFSLMFLMPLHMVSAVEALSTADLASHCVHYEKEPNGVDAVFCIRYIQGFIDGAIATDEKVALNAVNNSSESESFSERAIRQRAARLKRDDPTFFAEFCLGTPVHLKKVVEKVVSDLNNRKVISKELLARDAVYYVLRKEYPCTLNATK